MENTNTARKFVRVVHLGTTVTTKFGILDQQESNVIDVKVADVELAVLDLETLENCLNKLLELKANLIKQAENADICDTDT